MQIIIPMSGFGERFRRAGYDLPKPLIPVDGKPIIAHVIDLFPGETEFVFICNEDHLSNPAYAMGSILRKYCPTGIIVPIKSHKLGPVNAVLQAKKHIDLNKPTIVNYCDFACYWDFEDFKSFVDETKCVGAIPAYKGLHPHSFGSTFYAYMKHQGLWMLDIQEKKPYTDEPNKEYASSGTYYFKSGKICIDALERQVQQELDVNGEYYVSLAYKILLQDNHSIAIYDLQHFMQWGTPSDLVQYEKWSKVFRKLLSDDIISSRHTGIVLIPMAGLGSRFANVGFDLPKPLIPVSGRPMVLQAVKSLPIGSQYRFVTRQDMAHFDDTNRVLRSSFLNVQIKALESATEGQALTCLAGLEKGFDSSSPLTIGACDNGVIYNSSEFDMLMADDSVDVIIWTVRGHPDGIERPEMFGWADVDNNGNVLNVSVKKGLGTPETDALITGTFTFKRTQDFIDTTNSLISRGHRINNEFYVDSVIEDAIDSGLTCRVFDVENYISWGTPKDLAIFKYWQSCFHKWKSHPYSLAKDNLIPPSQVENLELEYSKTKPPRPDKGTVETSLSTVSNDKLDGQIYRFLPIGVGAVAIDFLSYFILIYILASPEIAKVVSFCLGAVFAYFGNKHFTFKRSEAGKSGKIKFVCVYLVALLCNVGVNYLVLSTLAFDVLLVYLLGFLAATITSAVFNFLGMKYFVFNGERL